MGIPPDSANYIYRYKLILDINYCIKTLLTIINISGLNKRCSQKKSLALNRTCCKLQYIFFQKCFKASTWNSACSLRKDEHQSLKSFYITKYILIKFTGYVGRYHSNALRQLQMKISFRCREIAVCMRDVLFMP